MKHLGDITQILGDKIEPVDCITFGSPCQDLSVAGKRAGLAGNRSGLFMEAVRIIEEMRWATNDRYPTFAVWENVPGAFSSNGGEDFRAVLEELAGIKEPGVIIPRPEKQWSKAGYIAGDGWSLAWRQLDAQHWGVPQRRKRIALVVDFGGLRAGEILFERTGVSGNPDQSIPPWQGAARNPEESVGTADRAACYGIGSYDSAGMLSDNPHSGIYEADTSRTLDLNGGNPGCNQGGIAVVEPIVYDAQRRYNYEPFGEVCETVQASYGTGGGNIPIVTEPVVLNDQGGASINVESGGVAPTIRAEAHQHLPIVATAAGFCTEHSAKARGVGFEVERAPTLRAGAIPAVQFVDVSRANHVARVSDIAGAILSRDSKGGKLVVYDARGNGDGEVAPTITGDHESRITDYTAVCVTDRPVDVDCRNGVVSDIATTLQARTGHTLNAAGVVATPTGQHNWIVRRLTPTECERLQGFPDDWTDIGEWVDSKGKKRKPADGPRYKALGNSIALPQWWWLTCKMADYLPDRATLGSLFDGIGGFPLVWETRHGKGTARWASEIEEFPIAVTKVHFPEDKTE